MQWQCDVPAAAFDLRLEVPGYQPLYFWDLSPSSGQALELSRQALDVGASLIGWTHAANGATAETVELVPATAAAPQGKLNQRLRSAAAAARPNERGFFQFKQLPPGTYTLLAHRPGFSTYALHDVTIAGEGEHTVPEAISLEPLARLDLALEPPLAPNLEPWQVRLAQVKLPEPPYGREIADSPAAPDGYWSAQDLVNGSYTVSVSDSQGARFALEDIEVAPNLGLITIRLPSVRVTGTVCLGKKPITAKLRLHQLRGRSVRFEANEEGQFSGSLPEAGTWMVEVVELEEQRTRLVAEPVEVEAAADGTAFVNVQLPDTTLRGRVVGSDGKPEVPCAVAVLRGRSLLHQALCDAEGGFTARGLPPGPLQLRAETSISKSLPQDYLLREDVEGPAVELILEREMVVHGQVSYNGRPVPGAIVRFSDPAGQSRSGQSISSVSGQFSLQLLGATRFVLLAVVAPGVPRQAQLVSIERDTFLNLNLSGPGGTLELFLPNLGNLNQAVLQHEGLELPLAFILDVHRDLAIHLDPSTGTLRLLVAPGSYSVCRSDPDQLCFNGVLVPGGSLQLGQEPDAAPEAADEGPITI